jgi:hypothetical protein
MTSALSMCFYVTGTIRVKVIIDFAPCILSNKILHKTRPEMTRGVSPTGCVNSQSKSTRPPMRSTSPTTFELEHSADSISRHAKRAVSLPTFVN